MSLRSSRRDTQIILLNDNRLTESIIEQHNVGVKPIASYEIKRIDFDYFVED